MRPVGRRLGLRLSTLALGLAACGEAEEPVAPSQAACKTFCVTVEPAEGDQETIFTFVGTGWRPRKAVMAEYGEFCDIEVMRACDDEGIGETTRADAAGTFRFRFRNGPAPVPDGGNGNGPVVFEQWLGRPYQSRLIRRNVPYRVDGRKLELRLGD